MLINFFVFRMQRSENNKKKFYFPSINNVQLKEIPIGLGYLNKIKYNVSEKLINNFCT